MVYLFTVLFVFLVQMFRSEFCYEWQENENKKYDTEKRKQIKFIEVLATKLSEKRTRKPEKKSDKLHWKEIRPSQLASAKVKSIPIDFSFSNRMSRLLLQFVSISTRNNRIRLSKFNLLTKIDRLVQSCVCVCVCVRERETWKFAKFRKWKIEHEWNL